MQQATDNQVELKPVHAPGDANAGICSRTSYGLDVRK